MASPPNIAVVVVAFRAVSFEIEVFLLNYPVKYEQSGLGGLFQGIIEVGYKVSGFEVNSFNDYKMACSVVK
jgi:hypothetical protein|tara:strand:+ start:516 stop:728 length:213 start_codon:yes stop_codon:yes gene_type:complete